MKILRKGSHTVYDLKIHLVSCTKYRKEIFKGDIALRCRGIIRQICEANELKIINPESPVQFSDSFLILFIHFSIICFPTDNVHEENYEMNLLF